MTLSRKALVSNARRLLTRANKSMFPVLKANAYGHGAVWAAQVLEQSFSEQQIPFFCVARQGEAEELIDAKVQRPILVLSHWNLAELELPPASVSLTVSSWEDMEQLRVADRNPGVRGLHFKINTGMNRLGFTGEDLRTSRWLSQVSELGQKGYQLEGLMSHLVSGELDPSLHSQCQLSEFEVLVEELSRQQLSFPWIHLENGGAASWPLVSVPWRINGFRPGLTLYGIDPRQTPDSLGLLPVLSVSGPLRQIQNCGPGATVGYGRHYVCDRKHHIGIVSLGYADGLDRRLSRKAGEPWAIGLVLRGVRVPFAGRISMDLCAVDLTEHPDRDQIRIGDPAFWISQNQDVSEIGQNLNRIPWEILCALGHRLRRIEVSE